MKETAVLLTDGRTMIMEYDQPNTDPSRIRFVENEAVTPIPGGSGTPLTFTAECIDDGVADKLDEITEVLHTIVDLLDDIKQRV